MKLEEGRRDLASVGQHASGINFQA